MTLITLNDLEAHLWHAAHGAVYSLVCWCEVAMTMYPPSVTTSTPYLLRPQCSGLGAQVRAESRYVMTDRQISWLSAKSIKKPDTVSCPVCNIQRNRGNHAKCSKITQLKHQQARTAGIKA